MERAVLVCDANVIHGHHLPPTLQTAEASGTVIAVALADAVAKLEKDLIGDGAAAAPRRREHGSARMTRERPDYYDCECISRAGSEDVETFQGARLVEIRPLDVPEFNEPGPLIDRASLAPWSLDPSSMTRERHGPCNRSFNRQ